MSSLNDGYVPTISSKPTSSKLTVKLAFRRLLFYHVLNSLNSIFLMYLLTVLVPLLVVAI